MSIHNLSSQIYLRINKWTSVYNEFDLPFLSIPAESYNGMGFVEFCFYDIFEMFVVSCFPPTTLPFSKCRLKTADKVLKPTS